MNYLITALTSVLKQRQKKLAKSKQKDNTPQTLQFKKFKQT